MMAYSDLKMVKASLESVPQIYFLTIFYLASWLIPKTAYLGLDLDAKDPKITVDEIYLFASLFLSYASTILSFVSAMNIRKHGQMTLANKVLVGLSATFQIAGRLWPMMVTSMLAIVDTPPLSAPQAALLVILPLVCHWVSVTFHLKKKNIFFLFSDFPASPLQSVGCVQTDQLLATPTPPEGFAPHKQHMGRNSTTFIFIAHFKSK